MDSDDEDSSYILRAEREAKQNFLKEEIIENDYDPELFTWYISSIQEADIDSWEFDQLQTVVREFKLKFRRGQTLDEVQGPQPKSEIQVKRDYLLSEVIQNGYEAELFMWFIEGLGEPDLNFWTFEKLQEAVCLFKEKFRPGESLDDVLGKGVEKVEKAEKVEKGEKVEEKSGEGLKVEKKNKLKKKNVENVEDSQKMMENETCLDTGTNYPSIGLTPTSPKVSKITELKENNSFKESIKDEKQGKHEINENFEDHENLEEPEDSEVKHESNNSEKPGSPFLEQDEVVYTDPKAKSLFDCESLLVLPCGTISETEISLSSDLKFSCGSPKLQKFGFFSKKFIEYELSTPALGWQVRRRYSDFIWLRDVLQSNNPGSYIPPLPSKKMMGNFEDQFIKKRSKLLNDFINTVLRDPNLRSSPDLVVFLNETNPNSLRLHQSKLKIPRMIKFEDISTLNGDTICDLNEDSELFEVLSDYLDVSESLEKQLKNSTKGLINCTKKASNTINEFAEMVQELQNSFRESEMADKLAEIMEKANNMLVKWAAHEEINGKNLEDDLKLHFDFKIKEKKVFKNMLQERNSRFYDYRKVKNKKGCDSVVENARNIFGHFNFKIRSEFERSFGDQVIYDREHFKTLATHEIEKAESLEALWVLTSNDFYQAPRLI